MAIPLRYNLRSIFYRKQATILTLSAIGLTVAVLVIVLALYQGFRITMVDSGHERNVIAMRVGSNSEGESSMTRDLARKIMALPEVAKMPDGKPFATPELFAAINEERVGASGNSEGTNSTNITVRGTTPLAIQLRKGVRIVEGKMFTPGIRELVVGKKLVGRVKGCRVGGSIPINGQPWAVVGMIDSDGRACDSEIWGDVELFVAAFDRLAYSTVIFRAADGVDIGTPEEIERDEKDWNKIAKRTEPTGLIAQLATAEFQLKALPEPLYYEKQAGALGLILTTLAYVLAGIMAVGAIFGCTNTLLASVAGRTHEIGALMAIGFKPWGVRLGFLIESLVLGLMGGALGVLIALPINGVATGTMNFVTFTEQAFSFRITPLVVTQAVILAAVVGLLGGTLPAIRASRLKPTDAIRSE
jgi:ABC-type antimicrobial peptide transport system permease subunit